MIFVTVGSDMPFDRLVQVVDEWVGMTGRTDVFAQIGNTSWTPRFLQSARFLSPPEFSSRLDSASQVISHAGMGTILSALHRGKPILVMPRRASLRETRNEHQLATVRRLVEMGRVAVAFDETQLRSRLDDLDRLPAPERIGSFAEPRLLNALRQFIQNGERPVESAR